MNQNLSLQLLSATSVGGAGTLRRLIAWAYRLTGDLPGAQDIYVLPASTPGSLGDAAMLAGLRELLGPSSVDRLRYFGYRDDREWVCEMGGRSAGRLPSSTRRFAGFAARARDLGVLYINGADVLDGKYSVERSLQRLRLAQFVADMGRPVTLTGFSLREDAPATIVRAFRSLPSEVRLCARDPQTYSRLNALVGRQPVQVADLAFLMKAAAESAEERAIQLRLEQERSTGRRLIGFCFNLHAMQLPGLEDAQRAECAVQCMRLAWEALHRDYPDCLPVILPHDFRGQYSDVALGRAFMHACGLSENTAIFIQTRCSAEALKAFCARLDVLITGRMHCGIAALDSGVPAVFFDYQGKVDGLLALFGLSSKVRASADAAACAEEIYRQAAGLIDRANSVKDQIVRALPQVRRLARANLHPGTASQFEPISP